MRHELAGFTTPGPIGKILGWIPIPEVDLGEDYQPGGSWDERGSAPPENWR